MKVFLLYADRDIDLDGQLPPNESDLTQDLELNTLLSAMTSGDKFLFDVAKRVVLSSLTAPEAITYRQQVLADCLQQPDIVRQLYDLAVDALESERKADTWGLFRDAPDAVLGRSIKVLALLGGYLRQLRQFADEHLDTFRSAGFVRLFRMLIEELDDEYLASIDDHLTALKLRRGALMSAELGEGNKGVRYVLHRLPDQSWMERWLEKLTGPDRASFSFQIADRDEAGFKALGELRGRGINSVANTLAQSTDHVLSFFAILRAELAFYIGCLNLHERLAAKSEPTCFPEPLPPTAPVLSGQGLYDICLTLNLEERVVGNDVHAEGKSLIMITGANQGGKSTFLRSVGLAHLMMHSGMFVAAQSLRANVGSDLFTHFKREEDATMESGKLDEELARMSDIADLITPTSVLLCNESFASTNEREGSEIARQVVHALTEAGVKVYYVTHLFDLADTVYRQTLDTTLFLRAERRPNGQRTYRLVKGQPRPTSHGEDAYHRIFATSTGALAGDGNDQTVTPVTPSR